VEHALFRKNVRRLIFGGDLWFIMGCWFPRFALGKNTAQIDPVQTPGFQHPYG
jgi:hypothetical protein